MPVWHERTKQYVADGKLALLGVVQEQHAERSRLFAQWKRIRFPVLQDPINMLGPSAVPIVVAIDEFGVVRMINPGLDEFEDRFLNASFSKPKNDSDSSERKRIGPSPRTNTSGDVATIKSADEAIRSGDVDCLWGGEERLDRAIAAYRRAIELEPSLAIAHFRLGVCLRRRFDSREHRPGDHRSTSRRNEKPTIETSDGDFQLAVDSWVKALRINPGQYVWRRRIQQYGPRLDKPYPFYDWIDSAINEIRTRGETPVVDRVDLTDSEMARPMMVRTAAKKEGGDAGRRDDFDRQFDELPELPSESIVVESTIVPGTVSEDDVRSKVQKPGDRTSKVSRSTVRVHLVIRPADGSKFHWNDEGGPLRVELADLTIKPDDKGRVIVASSRVMAPVDDAAKRSPGNDSIRASRRIEFEMLRPIEGEQLAYSGRLIAPICDDAGVCRLVRIVLSSNTRKKIEKEPRSAD